MITQETVKQWYDEWDGSESIYQYIATEQRKGRCDEARPRATTA